MHTLPNLPDAIAREVFATLCASLPAPITATPDAGASRDDVAIAAVAALHPTNAFEAKLAAAIVLAEAHYADSLRQAAEYRDDLATTCRCRSQAMAMLRQMRALLRDYQRMQAERDKALAAMHPAAMERAGWWFREASVAAPEPASAQPASAQPASAQPASAQPASAQPASAQPASAQPAASAPAAVPARRQFSDLTEAEQYALLHPARAARIRAAGGLPAPCDFGPPDPAIVEHLVHGSSPILLALDRHVLEPAGA